MSRGNTLDSIPSDLLPEIFSKLSVKSIAICCCVSKQWSSILGRQDFTELFFTRSSARPRLLFACQRDGMWLFFSSPQPQNPYQKSSLVVAAEFHTKCSQLISRDICGYASGLIYLSDMRISLEDEEAVRVICNPITGKYTILPKLRRYVKLYSYLGFDPIDKQYKVLFMASFMASRHDDHKILTLGTGKLRWRKIQCPLAHDPFSGGICINGVLYYLAIQNYETIVRSCVIVCFDIRSETFTFIDIECFYHLINYKGKLGGINWKYAKVDGMRTFELSMCVLEDVEKHEWSKYDYTFPEHEVVYYDIILVGMTTRGEVVFSEKFTSKPFYVFYFNPERHTLQRVEIKGLENNCRVYISVDHVEDLNINDGKQLKAGPNIITKRPKAQQRRSRFNKIYKIRV